MEGSAAWQVAHSSGCEEASCSAVHFARTKKTAYVLVYTSKSSGKVLGRGTFTRKKNTLKDALRDDNVSQVYFGGAAAEAKTKCGRPALHANARASPN